MRLDDRTIHNWTTTMERLDGFQVTLLPYPRYFPNRSSFDFFSFGRSKDAMRGQLFQEPETHWVLKSDYPAIWIPARLSQCSENGSRVLVHGSTGFWPHVRVLDRLDRDESIHFGDIRVLTITFSWRKKLSIRWSQNRYLGNLIEKRTRILIQKVLCVPENPCRNQWLSKGGRYNARHAIEFSHEVNRIPCVRGSFVIHSMKEKNPD
jgi:hypothetical protein